MSLKPADWQHRSRKTGILNRTSKKLKLKKQYVAMQMNIGLLIAHR